MSGAMAPQRGSGDADLKLRRFVREQTVPDVRHRAEAALCMVNSRRGFVGGRDDGFDVAAFMAVFHPEYGDGKTREVVRSVANRRNGIEE